MLKLEYTGLNTNKFHDELSILENYILTSKDGTTTLTFTNLRKLETNIIVDEVVTDTIIIYQKKRIENEIVRQDEQGNDIYDDIDYWDSFDFETLNTQIQSVVDTHDPLSLSLNFIRQQRNQEFKLVDKYQLTLVYNELTISQQAELAQYRQDWLDAPVTLIIPIRPAWLT